MNGGTLNRRGLTVKQQKFVKHYVATNGNGFQSAKAAGYNSSDDTLRSIASENLTKPHVAQELERTMRKALSADDVLVKLTDIAEKTPEFKGSDTLKALELIGRFHKLFTDRVETSSPQDELKSQIIQSIADKYSISKDRAGELVNDICGDDLLG